MTLTYKQYRNFIYIFLLGIYFLGISGIIYFDFNITSSIFIIGLEIILTSFTLTSLWDTQNVK